MKLISEQVGENPYWVDMETKIRSEDNTKFDIDKVRECLKICETYAKQRRFQIMDAML